MIHPYSRYANRLITKRSHVPSQLPLNLKASFYFFLIITVISLTIKPLECNHGARFHDVHPRAHHHKHHQILSTSEGDLFGSNLQDSAQAQQISNYANDDPSSIISRSSSRESTPPLTNSFENFYPNDNSPNYIRGRLNEELFTNDEQDNNNDIDHHQDTISPQSVLDASQHDTLGAAAVSTHGEEPFSPGFYYHSAEPQQYMQQDGIPSNHPAADGTANLLDWIEQGSGGGSYDNVPFDRPEDLSSATLNEYSPTPSVALNNPLMTPIFEQMPTTRHQMSNNAPILMRRLPMLVGTAGSPWRYKIPSSTFHDEDGDLRYLRSSLIMKQFLKSEYQNAGTNQAEQNSNSSSEAFTMKNLQWLQYDQNTQTLYGFPTEDDIGLNVFLLIVSDKWGFSSNETVKIAIRPHQSTKAITHSIRINNIELASHRRSSIPEVLMELAKSVTEGVFAERSTKNMIIQAYTLTNATLNGATGNGQTGPETISITWFNSSFPIHPCDLAGIESIFRALIDEHSLPPDWSLFTQSQTEYLPSQALLKSLSPDFRPSSVEINLLGACESKRSSDNNLRNPTSLDVSGPKIKNRLGKMKWKLGQPILYQIPQDVFTADDGLRGTRNLSLNLHTIDGKTLDQDPMYNFLEFEQETQTIFGLPFDQTKHVGSRELLLTARHPVTDQRTRETFIIDIEPQDLTTINNRAFRVSLYFMTQINVFGPREQVMLGRRMVTALDVDDLSQNYEEYADFTVIGIRKFTTGSYIDNAATLSDPANSWKYQDKIFLLDDSNQGKNSEPFNARDGFGGEGTVFYKLTWTNETIGYRGDCPVEVIKENILSTIERSMIEYVPPNGDSKLDDPAKNDSVRFYERLREFFEPAIDLIHLRFEPMSACVEALEVHDVGNSDLADIVDRAEDLESSSTNPPLQAILTKPIEAPKVKEVSPINSDEYWAIVVLIILVVAIFFVVMMLIMGLHTYRINQEKRFELQMKLAQARQNSMYLSSMVLADQIQPNDLVGQQQSNIARPVYMDERTSRKPVILDNEKQLLANGSSGSPFYKPTSVTLTGHTVQTAPLKPNMTFTMDSIANLQNTTNLTNLGAAETMLANQQMFIDDRQRSMTLNRRTNSNSVANRPIARQASASHLSHSQSIITVASMAPQVSFVPHSQANVPFVYAPMPVFYESTAETPYEL